MLGVRAYSRVKTITFNEQFLSRHYRLRYNTMKRVTEYQSKADGDSTAWKAIIAYHL